MGFFKNLFSQDVVKDKIKKDWAEQIYSMEGMDEITHKYALNLDKETQQLIPELKVGAFSSDNPVMREIGGKVLIEQMIEMIFQSSQNDRLRLKTIGIEYWHTPMGIAYGAINLIKPTDILEKKLFVVLIIFMVVNLNFGIRFNDRGMREVFKDNGWTEEETEIILNYK